MFRPALVAVVLSAVPVAAADPPADPFRPDNLVAWCVVPFDARHRTPAERADMLARLGFKRFAYDWRSEHLPTFDQEVRELKKRNIVYLSPREGWFMAAFALGDRAIAAALASDLPAYVLENIAGSKRYAEGTAVRIEVRTLEDVEIVKKLARIKIEN